jgi:hypothetical protein
MTLAGGGRFECKESRGLAGGKRREHQFYWTVVRKLRDFDTPTVFPENDDQTGDAGHRNHANYADHLDRFTAITAVTIHELRDRIGTVATAALESAPSIPDRTKYPDLPNVMALAYLRIYHFREYLDETLPTGNPFWRSAREAAWFMNVMRFPPRPVDGIRVG